MMTLPLGKIVQGDALEVLRGWPAASVHCVVTSTPYWGLRDYKAGAGGESLAGQWGQEPTIEEHVLRHVELFRELRRVLRPDGVVWFNYADSYVSNPGRSMGARDDVDVGAWSNRDQGKTGIAKSAGLKGKNLVGMPFRIMLALQADGWWWRSTCIWAKPNPMPESVPDRPSSAHEYVFLLTKSARYFYDADAVRRIGPGTHKRGGIKKDLSGMDAGSKKGGWNELPPTDNPMGANLRTVWEIPTQPYKGAHFATFPERLVEKELIRLQDAENQKVDQSNGWGSEKVRGVTNTTTTGWAPTCACEAGAPVPCVVLDPFAGSGTTGVVAHRLGRDFVGIDLMGGDTDLGGHTAHDRLAAARDGRKLDEWQGHREAGQVEMFEPQDGR